LSKLQRWTGDSRRHHKLEEVSMENGILLRTGSLVEVWKWKFSCGFAGNRKLQAMVHVSRVGE